jgi:hypothetical protein
MLGRPFLVANSEKYKSLRSQATRTVTCVDSLRPIDLSSIHLYFLTFLVITLIFMVSL